MSGDSRKQKPGRKRYVPAVGPRLKKLLFVVFGLGAVATNAMLEVVQP